MEQQRNADDNRQARDKDSLPVGEAASSARPKPIAESVIPPSIVQQNVSPKIPDAQSGGNETKSGDPSLVKITNDPLITRTVKDDELSIFEHRTLQYARLGIFVAIITLLLGLGTVVVFWGQFREMAGQTDLLAIAARQTRIDAKDASIAVAKQLIISQKQASSAQDAVKLAVKESTRNAIRVEQQLKLLQDQVKATREEASAASQSAIAIQKQTEISERPWLSVEVVPDSDLKWVNGNQASIVLKLSIKNLGKSPAKDIQVQGKIIPTSATMIADPRTAAKQSEICDKVQSSLFARVDLFPVMDQPMEERISISAKLADVDSQAITLPEAGQRRFVGLNIVGCVVYHSSFEMRPRHTYFAFRLFGPQCLSQEQKPLRLPSGMPAFYDFELGVPVPKDKLQKFSDFFARNDAE